MMCVHLFLQRMKLDHAELSVIKVITKGNVSVCCCMSMMESHDKLMVGWKACILPVGVWEPAQRNFVNHDCGALVWRNKTILSFRVETQRLVTPVSVPSFCTCRCRNVVLFVLWLLLLFLFLLKDFFGPLRNGYSQQDVINGKVFQNSSYRSRCVILQQSLWCLGDALRYLGLFLVVLVAFRRLPTR